MNTLPSLKLRLFGAFEAEVEGRSLPKMTSRKHEWLLALLALKHTQELPRTTLAGTLWPDSDEPAALHSLRQALADVRRALGSQAHRLLAPTQRTLRLDLSDAFVDVLAFDMALKHKEVGRVESALGLYRGPLLEGCLEEWALQERVAREEAFHSALERLAKEAMAREQPGEAASSLRRLIASSPLRESAYASLMEALSACGDGAGVKQLYRELRMLLHKELNAEPAPETTALYERLRQQARERAQSGVRHPFAPVALSGSNLELCVSPPAEPLSVSTVTLLFTDIEGSTPLWEQHPDAMRAALIRHNRLLRNEIEGHDGEVFKLVGDAVCALFPTAETALSAAMLAQQALQREEWPADAALKVRMALHTGAVERREDDCFGPTVNRVARLLSIGYGGQILLSAATRELLGERVPEGVSLVDRGRHRLKGLEQAMGVFEARHPALSADFPALRSLDAFPNNLPVQLSSFIGREPEIKDVKVLLSCRRLLTLTGSGGCGKTRLSLEVASEVWEDYRDGVWLVELAALTDASLVAGTVLQVLKVKEEPGHTPLDTLTGYLQSRSVLIVLDNCEHLVASCAGLVETLLCSCAGVKVLATSREALRVSGEQPWRVPQMQHPVVARWPSEEKDLSGVVLEYDACRLFVERARVQRPDFTLSRESALVLAQLCERLDGIPLAIEMAAARVRSMSLEEIYERLDQRFRLLKTSNRNAPARQQTLQALIDWSYELLSAEEQVLLNRLSMFAGGWTLEAAEQVCPDAQEEPASSSILASSSFSVESWEVLDLLMSLVDKSLVVADVDASSTRYRLLEAVRAYAADKLKASGEAERIACRHRDFFLAVAEEAKTQLWGPEQLAWLNRLESEHDNLRGALSWNLQRQLEGAGAALRLCGALSWFWGVRGHLEEGRGWCRLALGLEGGSDRTVERARALYGAGTLAQQQGDYVAARIHSEQSLEIKREIGDRRGIASSLTNLGSIASSQGDYAAARTYQEQSLEIFREIGDRRGVASSLINLGIIASSQGDYNAARAYYEQSLEIKREIGDRKVIASSLINLGLIASSQGDYAAARAYYEQGLVIRREIGDRRGIAESLESSAGFALAQGASERAARLWGAAAILREEIGSPRPSHEQVAYERETSAACEAMGAEAFAAAWALGRAMSVQQAVAYALEERPA